MNLNSSHKFFHVEPCTESSWHRVFGPWRVRFCLLCRSAIGVCGPKMHWGVSVALANLYVINRPYTLNLRQQPVARAGWLRLSRRRGSRQQATFRKTVEFLERESSCPQAQKGCSGSGLSKWKMSSVASESQSSAGRTRAKYHSVVFVCCKEARDAAAPRSPTATRGLGSIVAQTKTPYSRSCGKASTEVSAPRRSTKTPSVRQEFKERLRCRQLSLLVESPIQQARQRWRPTTDALVQDALGGVLPRQSRASHAGCSPRH